VILIFHLFLRADERRGLIVVVMGDQFVIRFMRADFTGAGKWKRTVGGGLSCKPERMLSSGGYPELQILPHFDPGVNMWLLVRLDAINDACYLRITKFTFSAVLPSSDVLFVCWEESSFREILYLNVLLCLMSAFALMNYNMARLLKQ
jgi:hypothetical protein